MFTSINNMFKTNYQVDFEKNQNASILIITGNLRYIGTQEKRFKREQNGKLIELSPVCGLPGGKVDDGELDFNAALREFREETKVDISHEIKKFTYLFTIISEDTKEKSSTITYVYFSGNFKFPQFTPQQSEIKKVNFPKLSQLFESVKTQEITCDGETLKTRYCIHQTLNAVGNFEDTTKMYLRNKAKINI